MKTAFSRPLGRAPIPARVLLFGALLAPGLSYAQSDDPPVDDTLRVLGHRTTLGPAAQLGKWCALTMMIFKAPAPP